MGLRLRVSILETISSVLRRSLDNSGESNWERCKVCDNAKNVSPVSFPTSADLEYVERVDFVKNVELREGRGWQFTSVWSGRESTATRDVRLKRK